MKMRQLWVPCLLALGMTLGMGNALAHGMGADGDGYHGRQGHYGGGAGMMGGQHGMGPGMMGGYQGMGPGMMGGYQGMGPGMMGGMPGGLFVEMLTAEQLQQARELMRTHRTAQFQRMEEMAELRLDLRLLLQDPRPDPEQARALNQRLAELHGAMFEERLRLHNAMENLLTAEQRERLGLPGS